MIQLTNFRKMIVAFSILYTFSGFSYAPHSGDNIRALYLSAYNQRNWRFDNAMKIIQKTDLNAVVLDVKDVKGFLVYQSEIAKKKIPTAIRKYAYKNLEDLVKSVKSKGDIYTIARLVVFKDNYFTSDKYYPEAAIQDANGQPFYEKKGLKWIDPHNKEYWDYIVAIAKECYNAGFDEVQLDYIRFPGTSQELIYPARTDKGPLVKVDVIANFLKYVRQQVAHFKKPLSIDVFGLVGNIPGNDLGIGQIWEKLAPHTDIISPMTYPSHYPKSFAGFQNPDLHPYDVMRETIRRAINSNKNSSTPSKIRPWVQAFTAHYLPKFKEYTQVEMREQIRAIKEQGIDGYLLWDPRCDYKRFFPEVFGGQAKADSRYDSDESQFENSINYGSNRLLY